MQYASIQAERSHCQNSYQKSVNYWRNRNFPEDVAIRLANLRSEMLSLQHTNPTGSSSRKKKAPSSKHASPKDVAKLENLPSPEYSGEMDKNDHSTFGSDCMPNVEERDEITPTSQIFAREITQAEIDLEVVRQKALGAMSEVPPAALISSLARSEIQPSLPQNLPPKAVVSHKSDAEADSNKVDRRPYWIIAGVASTWLVHSMAQALGGGVWNYMIAAAFDYTPMLLIGARVNRETQKIAIPGAVGIFLIGLALYLAPSIQTAFNEYSAYLDLSKQYEADMRQYSAKNMNALSLMETAKKNLDESEKKYQETRKKYGDNSWRTQEAKIAKDKDFEKWDSLSDEADELKSPLAPNVSDNLRIALQSIGMRVGLFGIVFLSMFVMRRLEQKV